MATGRLQAEIAVGDPVKILGTVTAIGGTAQAPTITITTKYKGHDGNTDSITVDSIQTIKDS